jgi:hypothetical protein
LPCKNPKVELTGTHIEQVGMIELLIGEEILEDAVEVDT